MRDVFLCAASPSLRSWADDRLVLAWLGLGVAAVVVALIDFRGDPKLIRPLADFAKTWIGLALAAAYAYLGVKP